MFLGVLMVGVPFSLLLGDFSICLSICGIERSAVPFGGT